jgi:hypothetical protein
MPFVVQCPHDACHKYMLLEDASRGAKVECLVCSKLIQVESSDSGDRLSATVPRSQPPSPKPPSPKRQQIAQCPKCSSALRLPPSHQGQPIRCPKCGNVFTA